MGDKKIIQGIVDIVVNFTREHTPFDEMREHLAKAEKTLSIRKHFLRRLRVFLK